MILALSGPGNVRFIGLSTSVGIKLGYSVAFIAVLFVVRGVARWLIHRILRARSQEPARFWARQVLNLALAAVFIAGLLSIWFNNPAKLTTGLGLFSAGLAFALQQVITSIAGYVLILRGDIFTIGDRVVMGGVRGDVIALGFIRTTILEMGEPADAASGTDPTWVRARQYTGRIVTVANSQVFNEPVYNYTRDFPFLWEELRLPIPYSADRDEAERILLDVAHRHSLDIDRIDTEVLDRMRRRYFMPSTDLKPAVFFELTDNWVELTLRFTVPAFGIRAVKSTMSRQILAAFEQAGIPIASSTYDIVGVPRVHVTLDGAPNERDVRPR